MGAQENTRTSKPGRGSLDGLARRLGALEESLTVAAGELGVSTFPKLKHLNPDTIYAETQRQIREAIEPLRVALHELGQRLDEIATGQAQIRRELAEQQRNEEKIAVLDGRLAQLNARLDAAAQPTDRSDARLSELHEKIEHLALRLDTIWARLDAERQEQQNRPQKEAPEVVLAQRLGALELRLKKLANGIAAAAPVSGNPAIDFERSLLALRQELLSHIEQRPKTMQDGAADASGIVAAEVSRQIAALVRESASVAPAPTPLLSEGPHTADPLVMGAAERAIVRLTHRLEKLEEWRRRQRGEGKAKSGLMGRFFES